jgi:hypothetical protein
VKLVWNAIERNATNREEIYRSKTTTVQTNEVLKVPIWGKT